MKTKFPIRAGIFIFSAITLGFLIHAAIQTVLGVDVNLIVTLLMIILTSAAVLGAAVHFSHRYACQLTQMASVPELDYQKMLQNATAGLYENIFEVDITHNCLSGENTKKFFRRLGLSGDITYDEALQKMAVSQMQSAYAKGYINIFSREHILNSFHQGVLSLSYDFLNRRAEGEYQWVRLHAQLFYWKSDNSVRMITYHQNIDEQKKLELSLLRKSQLDFLSGIYNKKTAEDLIAGILEAGKNRRHALLIVDIDDFKNVNDTWGHTFGDYVIREFARELKSNFSDSDIVGRIGGDEFNVLLCDIEGLSDVKRSLETISKQLNNKLYGSAEHCHITASIGCALFPEHASDYSSLYDKADQALYCSKQCGKSIYTVYGEEASPGNSFYVNPRDMRILFNEANDGISKIAFMKNSFKTLYFNDKRARLTGLTVQEMQSPHYDVLEHIHPDDVSHALQVFDSAISTRAPFSVSYRIFHSDGHYIPVSLRGIFADELFENQYPVFYAIYTDLSKIEMCHTDPPSKQKG